MWFSVGGLGLRDLRILALIHGWYGKRIVKNIEKRAPDWSVKAAKLPSGLPPILDDTEEYVEGVLKQVDGEAVDLLLFLSEEASTAQLLPDLAEALGAEAVIAPADDYGWLPRGLERQLAEELRSLGVYAVFPRPFCSLSGGEHPAVREFCRRFGAPKLKIRLSGGVVEEVEVVRGAPCGSTHYMAEKLKGVKAEEAPHLAGLYTQLYPCLATHTHDPAIKSSCGTIHISGELAMKAVEKALKEAQTP